MAWKAMPTKLFWSSSLPRRSMSIVPVVKFFPVIQVMRELATALRPPSVKGFGMAFDGVSLFFFTSWWRLYVCAGATVYKVTKAIIRIQVFIRDWFGICCDVRKMLPNKSDHGRSKPDQVYSHVFRSGML